MSLSDDIINQWDNSNYTGNALVQFNGGKFCIGLFSKFFPFKGDEIILDVGCGDGNVSLELLKLIPMGNLVGIDISPGMLESAQARIVENNLNNIKLMKSSIEDVNFELEANSFDIVTSFYCFHWIRNKELAINNILKVLKPGGKFIVVAASSWVSKFLLYLMENNPKWSSYGPFNDCFQTLAPSVFAPELVEYKQLLMIKPVKIYHLNMEAILTEFESKLELFNFFKYTSVPYAINKIPNDKVDEFVEEILANYFKYTGHKEESPKFVTTPLVLIGEKLKS